MMRYSLMLLLFVLVAGMPSRPTVGDLPDPPELYLQDLQASARVGVERGRYSRSSRIFGPYLAAARDTTPQISLLAARPLADRGGRSASGRLVAGLGWFDDGFGGEGHILPGGSRTWLGASQRDDGSMDRVLAGGDLGATDDGVDHLTRGLALGAAGRTAAALTAFDQAIEILPWMADWANLFAAESVASAGDTAEVNRRLATVGPGLMDRRGWRIKLQAARQAGDLMAARQAALAAARNAKTASDRAAAWVVLGDLRLVAGEPAWAREAYRSAMEGAPWSTAAVAAARGLGRAGPTPDEWRMIGVVYLRHGNPARAIAGFERYLESGAGGPAERAQARLQIGHALFNAGRYGEAERRLLALADEPVAPRIAADALFRVGHARYRQGRMEESRRTLASVGERFPDQEAAARALFLLADIQHDELDLPAAMVSYRGAASASTTLEDASLALVRLGGLHYLAGEYGQAAEVFEEYRARRPEGRRISQTAYWAARSHSAMGRHDEATALLKTLRAADPLSYYGIRAGEILGESVLAFPMEPSPPRRERIDAQVEVGLRRVDVLDRLGRRAELADEVERLREHFARHDGGEYALAEGLSERGYTLTAISIGWNIFQSEGAWNRRLLRVIYPFPFQAMVLPESLAQDVDPYLVAAVIRRESAFNPAVTSSAGAIGLMQIMPHTGRGLARSVGLQRYHPDMLLEPELNLHLGIRYLANLLSQFDGEIPLVLSAYNAGPNRAVRWRSMPERQDAELFMERIPFAETRDYVRHVKLHRALYRELYPRLDGTETLTGG